MSATRHALLLALSLLAVPAALASPFFPGPHAGTLHEGEVNRHLFIVFPFSQPCRQVETEHTLTLVYAPPTDTLTLTVLGQTAVGQDGVASVTFSAPPCTAYSIEVAGTDVGSVAAYDVVQAFTPEA